MVRDLKADDFELLEDGARQQILTFAYEEITSSAAPVAGGDTLWAASVRPSAPLAAPGAAASLKADVMPSHPLTSDEVAGHRLLTLVFDTSSMDPDDVQKALDGALKWVDAQMTSADLVAVTTINTSLQVLTDFTNSKERVRAALSSLSSADSTAFAAVDASTSATDAAAQTATDDSSTVDQSAQELDTFNNDVRLRALRTLADALQPIQQKKAIIYFSSGMKRNCPKPDRLRFVVVP